MSPSQALAFKEQGNVLFKSLHFRQAADLYEKASNCDPDNPTYPSNLSAALYELGDYLATLRAILRAFHILAPNDQVVGTNVQLARKLSVRLVKALLHGSRNRKIPDDVVGRPEHQSAFRVLEHIISDDPNGVELWRAWGAVAKEKPDDAFKAK
ncbi:hypothetical protein BDM02DRAFT_3127460 [Thelephora ganbajun]|uniref:Uncharacterized protein n=1 Tax=Thelephora ganbajun TaxID=370292 RepID=A0ACB6ZMJ8_THEGA|nr:hypothetical protein BDM02DRAFT_3127460 [Thelephora ganbajun]